uniref:Uncharacterized protein n=1 Tax=Lygus hesperus TaxID=30085 RepID=A0A146LD62_LYGHE
MRRNQKVPGLSIDHSTPLKTSRQSSSCREGCSLKYYSGRKRSTISEHSKCSHRSSCSHHTSCSRHSELRCQPNRTVHHCCLPREHEGCCSSSWQPQVSCCHREPPKCHGCSHSSCGCGNHSSCYQPPTGSCGGSFRHHSCSSKSHCARIHCGFDDKVKAGGYCHDKKSQRTSSESREDGQWFIKEWVEQSKSRVGGKKSPVPEEQCIESQLLTNRATYGGSEVGEAMSDDDNFTSISQVLPMADPDPPPNTILNLQGSKPAASSSDSDSGSSLSDTSTLFLTTAKPRPVIKPCVRLEKALNVVKDSSNQEAGLILSTEKIEDSQGTEVYPVVDNLPSSDHEQNRKTGSTQIEPVPDGQGSSEPDAGCDVDTQKTCSQEFSPPQFLPIKRPGCRHSSDSDDSPDKSKKKRKLYNPSDSSWYFDSARRYSDVHTHTETSGQSNEESAEVEGSSGLKNVKDSVEGINLDEDGMGNAGVAVEDSQDSPGIIPPSDVEIEPKISGGDMKKNVISKSSSGEGNLQINSEPEFPSKKLIEGIIEEWGSDNNSSIGAVQTLKTVNDLLKDLEDEDAPVVTIVPVESSPKQSIAECGEKSGESQTRPQLNEEPGTIEDLSCVADQPPSKCSSEQHQNMSNTLTRASLNTQLSPDDSIFANETLMEAEMSQTLCEPQELSINVAEAGFTPSHSMSLTLVNSNVLPPANSKEIENPPAFPELSKSPSGNPLTAVESNTCDRNHVSETENSSADVGKIIVEVPVTVHAVEGSPSDSPKDFRLPSPDSTTEGLSEELRQEEQPGRNSPASTIFYDAESADDSSVGNCPEGGDERSANPNRLDVIAEDPGENATHLETSDNGDISERVSMPNQVFGVDGAIVDIAPHINESSMSSILEAVCRRGCKSRFGHDEVLDCPTIFRACKLCATRSHYACPICQESGSQKPLCWEFKFELHVLIGEKILRLEVGKKEAVKFLGIQAKEFLRKGSHAMETLRRLEGLCCADPEEKVHRLSGRIYIKTEQRNDKIVPLLVSTRLKDFKMSKTPL